MLNFGAALCCNAGTENLIALGVVNGNTMSIVIVNADVKEANIEGGSLWCKSGVSDVDEKTTVIDYFSESMWMEHGVTLKPRESLCVAVAPATASDFKLKIDVNGETRDMGITNVDGAKAWFKYEKKDGAIKKAIK